jgi:hypothetical protein
MDEGSDPALNTKGFHSFFVRVADFTQSAASAA